ncbi:hypothetical protein EVAR_28354_1 [Eumeta japonica]|uniref:Uncharacterized protein n=1 Tax=Eumeta variegata TaxID=151549 RepID=A0A4C1VC19_EUMVA|nr:hypothetical protein EVAR_28354_1 [Eumeta japonica]
MPEEMFQNLQQYVTSPTSIGPTWAKNPYLNIRQFLQRYSDAWECLRTRVLDGCERVACELEDLLRETTRLLPHQKKRVQKVWSNKQKVISINSSALTYYFRKWPPVLLWSMRFEAKHRTFKIAAQSSSNRKKIYKTLAIRQQLQLNEFFLKGNLGGKSTNISPCTGIQDAATPVLSQRSWTCGYALAACLVSARNRHLIQRSSIQQFGNLQTHCQDKSRRQPLSAEVLKSQPLGQKSFALLALVAVAFAAPKPAPAPAPAPAPQPQFLTYTSGLDYVYPAAPAVLSPYTSPLTYSAAVPVLYR